MAPLPGEQKLSDPQGVGSPLATGRGGLPFRPPTYWSRSWPDSSRSCVTKKPTSGVACAVWRQREAGRVELVQDRVQLALALDQAEAGAAGHRHEERAALALLLGFFAAGLLARRGRAPDLGRSVVVAAVVGDRAAAASLRRRLHRHLRRRPPAAAAASAALIIRGEHGLFERVLQLGRRELLRQLDVRLHFQRLAELLEPDLTLLEPDDRDDAEVDVRARADRVLVEPRARAQLQRFLQQRARRLVVLLVVGVERPLVQVRDLVDRGLVVARRLCRGPRPSSARKREQREKRRGS